MKTVIVRPTNWTDEVGELVDSLLADPSKADHVKARLRRKMGQPETNREHESHSVRNTADATAVDDDEMWDNVPV
ncbi:MAG: hypothetical protein GKR98_07975 [Boseongicola sp.]|nr:MAG: hypothetical protein GKR98_07975 [Boseongicola sp.]